MLVIWCCRAFSTCFAAASSDLHERSSFWMGKIGLFVLGRDGKVSGVKLFE
jgi:hypothetical protein